MKVALVGLFTLEFDVLHDNFASQKRFAMFRNPYKMILQIVRCMAGFAIMLHARNILESSPKGEGFFPIPRRGH